MEYDGEWKDDAKNGTGTKYYPGGTKYIGSVVNNQENGKGKMFTGYSIYDGEWKNGWQNGYGKTTFNNDGSVYSGNYVNGSLQGSGTITYTNGASETGVFVDGSPSGKWIFKGADGTTEERYFKSPGMYSVYKTVETGYDAKKVNDEYNAWWQKTYGSGGTQNYNNMNLLKQQKEQETFDQRRQKEREDSQNRIADMQRQWDRSTDNFNRKYGRY